MNDKKITYTEFIDPAELQQIIPTSNEFRHYSCPYCANTLDYDDSDKTLFCSCCGKSWDFANIRRCETLYNDDPLEYNDCYIKYLKQKS